MVQTKGRPGPDTRTAFFVCVAKTMADYATIIDTIDTAIENWASVPATLSIAGRSITYRSIDELLKARSHYAALAAQGTGKGFKITNLKATTPR